MENTASHKIAYKLAHRADKANFSSICLMKASAVEDDQAHNPEVVGSNPTPATKTKLKGALSLPFSFWDDDLKELRLPAQEGIGRWCSRDIPDICRVALARIGDCDYVPACP